MKEINNPFEKHIFVCCNTKADGKGCARMGGEKLRDKLKAEAIQYPEKKIRVNKSGCLGFCERSIAVAVYPEGKMFVEVDEDANLEDFIGL